MSAPKVAPSKADHRPGRGQLWLEFLGSMNLAITLLVTVAIASIIGTVLKQNEPYQDYIIKFGPYWFEVFERLGLFDVYSAGWFLLILAFLVISTSVCIYRNAPHMLRELRSFRLQVKRNSLRAFHQKREWSWSHAPADIEQRIGAVLGPLGYRIRVHEGDQHRLLAAAKGRVNRLGYLFTHAAIVIICVGGLIDGNVPLKVKAMLGEIKHETRNIPASEVPPISRLSVRNPSFRGSVTIPEGGGADLVFLRMHDGFLVQPLPFSIELVDFRIDHYATGQPKSYESDLVLRDKVTDEVVEATIAVNHPLVYKGYAIYQSSFEDGGTGLDLRAWDFAQPMLPPQEFSSAVFENVTVESPAGNLRLELDDFRPFNINPVEGENGEEEQRNFGPNFTFKLRNAAGEALEFENFMLPVPQEGRLFFISGVRSSQAEPFRYLHLPADASGSLSRFIALQRSLHDAERAAAAARTASAAAFDEQDAAQQAMREQVEQTMLQLLDVFLSGGFAEITRMVEEQVPPDARERVNAAYNKALQQLLSTAYLQVLVDEGVDLEEGVDEFDATFYDDAVTALSTIPMYGSPFFLQLTDFQHLQASGLQIARAPGQNVVYLGFALLCAGVFLMFYVAQRRVWCWIDRDVNGATRLLVAGTGNRDQRDFAREFEATAERMDAVLQASTAQTRAQT